MKLAELWLDPATDFPAGATEAKALVGRPSGSTASLPTWKRLCDPVAQRVSAAWVEGLPEEVRAQAGPMLAMLGQMGGLAFGSQLGSGLGQLAAEVLTSTRRRHARRPRAGSPRCCRRTSRSSPRASTGPPAR